MDKTSKFILFIAITGSLFCAYSKFINASYLDKLLLSLNF